MISLIARGSMISLVPPMAMNSSPTAQPTNVLVMRARNNITARFMNGSLVATMELIAHTGSLLAIS